MEQLCQGKNNIAIVGGGPSGIYCALNMLKLFKENKFSDFKITIFDKAQILRTILPTGNSRCNITNATWDIDDFILNYPRGDKFLKSIFSKHFVYDSLDFFKTIGIDTYIQPDNRIFPKSNSSKDVKDKMLNALLSKNIVLKNKIIINYSELNQFDKIVFSCGSRGVDELINSSGHNIIPFKKALCALNVENFNFPKGVSISSLDGDFIFTDKGISGPLAFKISSINAYKEYPYKVLIRLFEYDDLINEINKNSKKSIGNIVSNFVPKSFAQVFVKNYDKKAAEISKKELLSYCSLELNIISSANTGEIVNAGGVDLDEINSNCKSKIKDNLWFCGEILNIDGFCGGFNLQNCWSTGFVVANDIVRSIINK